MLKASLKSVVMSSSDGKNAELQRIADVTAVSRMITAAEMAITSPNPMPTEAKAG